MKYTRLVVTVAVISVMVASTFAYAQFNVQATKLPQACPPSGCPPSPFPPGFKPKFTYTVEFSCTYSQSLTGVFISRSTDIKIHNPSFADNNASIVKKFVLATPEQFNPPPSTQTVPAKPLPYVLTWAILKPDAAMSVDCAEILQAILSPFGNHPPEPPDSLQGFVIIYSDTGNLDVWVQYIAQSENYNPTTQTFDPTTSPALEIMNIAPEPFTS